MRAAGSPTYRQWVGAELSADKGHQLFIPIGFGQDFITLEPNCEVIYKCSDTYAPEADGGISWDSVGIDWPMPEGTAPELSDKDKVQPTLAEFDTPFVYDCRPLAPLAWRNIACVSSSPAGPGSSAQHSSVNRVRQRCLH